MMLKQTILQHLTIPGHLCYIGDNIAWFTTCDLDKQQGDDWNDVPYEHNAGLPYGWTSRSKVPKYELHTVRFHADAMQTPADMANYNSNWAVEDINFGLTPWLSTDRWWGKEHIRIYAGETFEEFVNKVQAAGGDILVPLKKIMEIV